jgi:hypothetical protein
MTETWWPTPLAHIPAEDPWSHDVVMVSEVRSFEGEHPGQRITTAVLVPIDEVDDLSKNLAHLDYDMGTSGPHPSFVKDKPYKPKFWISGRSNKQYEPLVLRWSSHQFTVLQVDPGFLMTYGLTPRPGENGTVYWDDPRTPKRGVVTVGPPSVWNFPSGTPSFISISKNLIQDYLSLRRMALFQSFWEIRYVKSDTYLENLLGTKSAIDIDYADRKFQINRSMGGTGTLSVQVWGARSLAVPGALPISSSSLDIEGLIWPNIDKPVTNQVARSLSALDYVYVEDAALAFYEGKPEYEIRPESASVKFGTQWSVSYCDRIGRSLIRLELRKLYEGAPPDVVRHWHSHAVPPVPKSAYPAILNELNIAKRAKAITYGMVDLGEAMKVFAGSLELTDMPLTEFVTLGRHELDYSGWWTYGPAEVAARHSPLTLPLNGFLTRCLELDKLTIEGLLERSLRKLVLASGVPSVEISSFKTIKLLDLLVKLAAEAKASGLTIKDGKALWQRLLERKAQGDSPVSRFVALHELRVIGGHKVDQPHERLWKALAYFGVTREKSAAGFGEILDDVYGSFLEQLCEITHVIGTTR